MLISQLNSEQLSREQITGGLIQKYQNMFLMK